MRTEDIERFKKFLDLLSGKEAKSKYEYMALCPAHGDARLSLWVKLDDNGKIIVYCHAGCSPSDICAALKMTLSSLYPVPQIVDIFDYITIDGELLYQEIKFDKTALKRFKVRRPSDKKHTKDSWIWNVDNTPLILYNLFEVSNLHEANLTGANLRGAEDTSGIVFMCEGAKDARTLAHLSLVSTAALFNDWIKTDTTPLDNKKVVILVDNDEAGETKALVAAHDRYKKSSSIKLLRLPDLQKSEDVTDWLEKRGGTKEKLLELAISPDLKEWYPKESVRERVENKEITGLAFEHNDPRPTFEEWLETFHPSEEGPLYFYDDFWMKGNPELLIYKERLRNKIINEITEFLRYCYNRKGKSEELFKPTPFLIDMILKSGESLRDLDVIENPIMPIFQPFFMPEKEKNYKYEDIILMKSCNFYIPEKICFPRNMDACISLFALPFDYDENAKCDEIDKAFETQWKDDQQATNLLLEFIYYCMKHSHKYKSLLCMTGKPDSGKSQILELIRNFIGKNSCEAISLSKIGRPFELYRARNSKLLISDDVRLTENDLKDGSIVENLLSIPGGAPIRIEKKGGIIITKKLPCQIILAGNDPPHVPQISDALANRFFFLDFTYTFVRGKDMNPLIIETWIQELPGLFNKVLKAGMELDKRGGFVEPLSSLDVRSRFEGGSMPIRQFIKDRFDINNSDDKIKWFVKINDMKTYYDQYCEEEKIAQLSLQNFNTAIEAISGITRGAKNIKVPDEKTGNLSWKQIRGWIGVRRRGTSGNPNDEVGKTGEF